MKWVIIMLKIGKIVNTHGLKGEVRIISDFQYKETVFKKNNHLFVNDEELIINSYRIHKNFDMVTFQGINDINEVLKYKGSNVYINKEDYEFPGVLYDDLIGVPVYNDGNKIGEVKEIYHNVNQDLLVIKNDKKQYLVPYVTEFIKEATKEKIEINVIEGLIDED